MITYPKRWKHVLPTVLIQIVKSYVPGLTPKVPIDSDGPFATLKYIRPRQEDDLFPWSVTKALSNGVHKVYIREGEIFTKNDKLGSSRLIDSVQNPLTIDMTFLTQDIVVTCEPPDDQILFYHLNNTSAPMNRLYLGVENPERSAFYRDDDKNLHVMLVTQELTYDFTLGYQDPLKPSSYLSTTPFSNPPLRINASVILI